MSEQLDLVEMLLERVIAQLTKAEAALSAARVSAQEIDIKLELGYAGLWYVSSSAIPGLLITGVTQDEALAKVGKGLLDLQNARALARKDGDKP